MLYCFIDTMGEGEIYSVPWMQDRLFFKCVLASQSNYSTVLHSESHLVDIQKVFLSLKIYNIFYLHI